MSVHRDKHNNSWYVKYQNHTKRGFKYKKDAIEFADTDLDFVDKYFNLSEEDVLIKRWRIGKQENNEESFKRYNCNKA